MMINCIYNTFVFQIFTGLLKHMPPPASTAAASSSSSDQNSNAQTTVPTIPRGHLLVGPKEQLCLFSPISSTAMSNHYVMAGAHTTKHSGGAPRPPSSLNNEDDGGGRVKKKRKKKDKRERDLGGEEVAGKESTKPKKRKQDKEAVVVTLRKNKESKEGRERREPRIKGKDVRKGSGAELKNVVGGKEAGAAVGPKAAQRPIKVPGKRGRKPKVLPPVSTNEGTVLVIT